MKPLRVAMLSMHTCPLATLGGKETGGMNVYVRDLSRELSRRGVLVDVFTRSQNPAIPSISYALGPGTRVIHVPAGPEAPLDKNVVFNYVPEFVDRIQSLAEREGAGYDVIHSHYWLSGWAARDLRAAWGAPIIQMFHTLGHMKNSVAQTEADKEADHRIEVEREIMDFADRLVAATPLERAQMSWLYGADPARISVVPCGVDSNLFTPRPRAEARAFLNLPEDQRVVLFVGRIERLKGIDTLIRAMDLVLQRHPEWKTHVALSIIGGTPDDSPAVRSAEMERLRALREELGLTDLVAFLGAKSQDTLPYYYSAAEMVVVPSHYESFGMVALEAMVVRHAGHCLQGWRPVPDRAGRGNRLPGPGARCAPARGQDRAPAQQPGSASGHWGSGDRLGPPLPLAHDCHSHPGAIRRSAVEPVRFADRKNESDHVRRGRTNGLHIGESSASQVRRDRRHGRGLPHQLSRLV